MASTQQTRGGAPLVRLLVAAVSVAVLFGTPAASAESEQQFEVIDKLLESVTVASGAQVLNLGLLGHYTFEGAIGNISIGALDLTLPEAEVVKVHLNVNVTAEGDVHNKHGAHLGSASGKLGATVTMSLGIPYPSLSHPQGAASIAACDVTTKVFEIILDHIHQDFLIRDAVNLEVKKKLHDELCKTDLVPSYITGSLANLTRDMQAAASATGDVSAAATTLLEAEESRLHASVPGYTPSNFFNFAGSATLGMVSRILTEVFDIPVRISRGPQAIHAIEAALPPPVDAELTELGVALDDRAVWENATGDPIFPAQPSDFPRSASFRPAPGAVAGRDIPILPNGIGAMPPVPIAVRRVSLASIDLQGMDTVRDLSLHGYGGAAAPHALFASVGFGAISFSAELDVEVVNTATGYSTRQSIRLRGENLTGVAMNASATLLVNEKDVSEFKIADFLSAASAFGKSFGTSLLQSGAAGGSDDALRCLLYPVKHLNLTTGFLTLSNLSDVHIEVRPSGTSGAWEPFPIAEQASNLGLLYVVRPLLLPSLAALEYQDALQAVNGFIAANLTRYINQTEAPPCMQRESNGAVLSDEVSDGGDDTFIRFNDITGAAGRAVGFVSWGINKLLGVTPSYGVPGAPPSPLTQFKPDVNNITEVLMSGDPVLTFNLSSSMSMGSFSIGVGSVEIRGLDTVDVLDVLKTLRTDAFSLSSVVAFQNVSIALKGVSLGSTVSAHGPFSALFDLTLSMPEFMMNVTSRTLIKRLRLTELSLQNLTCADCAASLLNTTRGLTLPNLSGSIGNTSAGQLLGVFLNVTSEDGLPGLYDLAQTLQRPDGMVELTDFINTQILSSSEGQLNKIVNRNATLDILDRALQKSGAKCQVGPDPTPPAPPAPPAADGPYQVTQRQTYFLIYGLVTLCACILTSLVLCGRVVRRRRLEARARLARRARSRSQVGRSGMDVKAEGGCTLQADESARLVAKAGAQGSYETYGGDEPEEEAERSFFDRMGDRYFVGDDTTDPLVYHETTGRTAAWFFPSLIMLAIGVFFAGNLTLGSSVAASLKAAGAEVDFKNVYTYNLASTVTDTWNGNARLLAVVISLTSGVWPYMKLFLLVFCWFADDVLLPAERRGRVLRVIDFLGKWSLTDDFLQAIMMVSFRFHLVPPATWDFLPKDFFIADLEVRPEWGLYTFLSAAISTLILNHVQIAYHRTAQSYDSRRKAKLAAVGDVEQGDVVNGSFVKHQVHRHRAHPDRAGHHTSWFDIGSNDSEKRVLCLFREVRPGVFESKDSFLEVFSWRSIRSDCGVGVGVLALLLLSTCLLVWGAVVESFSFEFEALAGMVLRFFKSDTLVTSHSVLTLATAMYDEAPDGILQHVGYAYLLVTFVIFAFAMPLLQNVFLAILWAFPLNRHNQKRLFFINEVIAAWSSLEVFVWALIVALLELPNFAQFMGESMCSNIGIQVLLDEGAAPLGLTSTECFRVKTELLGGCWILFASAVISNATFFITWRAANSMIRKVDRSREVEEGSSSESSDESDQGRAASGEDTRAMPIA